jgi:hypothetical protein
MTTEPPWPWPKTMDALVAAPASHRVLLENDRVRVLEVVIEPRTRESEHTHQAASVMIIDEPARIRYYRGDALHYESQARSEPPAGVRVRWMEPEGPHSVQTSTSAATTQSASSSSNADAATHPAATDPTDTARPGQTPGCRRRPE